VEAHGLHPRGRVVMSAVAGAEPVIMLTAPGPASAKCLERAGMTVDDIDLWEINEAFASVTLQSIRELGIEEDRVNVNGGAVALGHPIGASGARIRGVLVYELRRRGGGLGVAAICSGGGQGDAVILRVHG
ncbi:MAG: acetyl-CoA C-acetyltransferase, partial [Baekduia sp.]|nr:acetyl-CoA C-acetyltransferase [Baekduia sp.]